MHVLKNAQQQYWTAAGWQTSQRDAVRFPILLSLSDVYIAQQITCDSSARTVRLRPRQQIGTSFDRNT